MKWVIENVDGTLHPVLHMYDVKGHETINSLLAESMVVDTPEGPLALSVPTPEAIHVIQ